MFVVDKKESLQTALLLERRLNVCILPAILVLNSLKVSSLTDTSRKPYSAKQKRSTTEAIPAELDDLARFV